MSNRYDKCPEINIEPQGGLPPPNHRVDIDEQHPGEARELFSQAIANLVSIICIKRNTELSEKLTKLTTDLCNVAYKYEKWI